MADDLDWIWEQNNFTLGRKEIHQNSLKAYNEIMAELPKKRGLVFDIIARHAPCTGSEVSRMYRSAYQHSSTSEVVRNRITELVKAGVIIEVSSKTNKETGHEEAAYAPTWNLPQEYDTRSKKTKAKDDVLELIQSMRKKLALSYMDWDKLITKVKNI